MAATGGLGAMSMEQSLMGGASMMNYDLDMGNEEEIITDEDFLKSLSKQEQTIFNALVISIKQLHMIRQKKFQKRRMEYLESMSNNEQFMFNQDGLNQLLGGI